MSTLAARPIPAASTGAAATARLPELDFVKGALILFMVLYHWWSIFISPFGEIFVYLRFLTPSFICISGFIVSSIYFSKYPNRGRIASRLLVRGLKLLGVFVALNAARMAASALWLHLPLQRLNASALYDIWVTGNGPESGNAKLAAFHILVPIGYLLLALAPLVLLCRRDRRPIGWALVGAWLLAGFLSLSGAPNVNLELLAIGLLGAVLGALPLPAIQRFLARRWPVIAIAYAGYAAAIGVWGVPYVWQVVGVPLTLAALYALGIAIVKLRAGRPIVFFGRYSLVGYIVQIAILQVLEHLWGRSGLGLTGLLATFAAALLGTYFLTVGVDRLRQVSPLADSAYKAVFA
ncbi:MAG TPA: acyltransferase family protein [Terriglobales bacterium]|nr:acyltransferase family protein [Terriglobales bacterium]